MARYSLSADSFVCISADHAVFLDLRKDRYSALNPTAARALAGVVQGWPERENREEPATAGAERGEDVIRSLLTERLVTDDEMTGKPATPVHVNSATVTFMPSTTHSPRLDVVHLRNFVGAWLSATLMFRLLSLKTTVERARRRKASAYTSVTQFDLAKAYPLMMAYFILRPHFFNAANACLRDSLTVVEFLARYGLFPTWVFGVRMYPFAAHSWVQAGSVVLNDYVDHVNSFTPIMAI